jgi:hypothetical protein
MTMAIHEALIRSTKDNQHNSGADLGQFGHAHRILEEKELPNP